MSLDTVLHAVIAGLSVSVVFALRELWKRVDELADRISHRKNEAEDSDGR